MNPTTQVIKRFCCTLSSGQASARDVCMQRVFLRVLPPCDSKLKRCSCRCLISPRQARWVVGWEGVGFLLRSNAACSDAAGARQQRFSTRGATANYAAIGNFHAGSGQSAKNRVGWAGRLQQSACMPGNADQDRTHTSAIHGLSSISVDIDEIRGGTLPRFHPYTALHRTS